MRNLRARSSTNWFRPVTPPAPAAAQAAGCAPSDTKIPSGGRLRTAPSPGSEAATLASDEICKGDEDRLERLSNSPTSDEVMRFLIELRCEKLRPQLLSLAEQVDDKAPPRRRGRGSQTPPQASFRKIPELVVRRRPCRRRECERPNLRRASPTTSLRAAFSRDATRTRWTAPNLPQLLLALFGEDPRNSATARRLAYRWRAGGPKRRSESVTKVHPRRAAVGRPPQSTTGFWPPSMDRVTPVM